MGIVSGGGGGAGGLPAQWTQAATGAVVATANAGAVPLQVASKDTAAAGVDVLEVVNVSGDNLLLMDSGGACAYRVINGAFSVRVGGSSRLRADATSVALATAGAYSTIYATEWITGGLTAAPASGDMDVSEFAFWLDDTIGATKLMVKAKDSGGTVRAAAIALT